MKVLRRLVLSKWVTRTVPVLLGAILGAVIGLIPTFVGWNRQSDERREEAAIAELVNNEAEYTLDRSVDAVVSLYSDDAVILDAGTREIWSGRHEFRLRYLTLPDFVDLKHRNIQIRLGPPEGCATAVTDTICSFVEDGQVESNSSSQGERWTFVKVNGEWRIDSFTYGLSSFE